MDEVLILLLETCAPDDSLRLTCEEIVQMLNPGLMMSLRTIEFLARSFLFVGENVIEFFRCVCWNDVNRGMRVKEHLEFPSLSLISIE